MATPGGSGIVALLPDWSHFRLPCKDMPMPTPPAPTKASIMRPFNISDRLFAKALDVRVPLTVTAVYVAVVVALDRRSASRNYKPTAMSRSRLFSAVVLFHNLLLVTYSAWTFWGMLGALRRSVVAPSGPGGLAGAAESLCRIYGPSGLGSNAAALRDWLPGSPLANRAPVSTREMLLLACPAHCTPPTRPPVPGSRHGSEGSGCLWTQGLDYYGWIFYLSKFYEVLDSFIILLRGKRISLLQVYHHAGAMLCMWAGIRYVSAPIWLFVLVNSFIHSLMYSYYSLVTLFVRIPAPMKKALTIMQIAQFVVGSSYAILHLFIGYRLPVYPKQFASAGPASGSAGDEGQNRGASPHAVLAVQPCIASAHEAFAIWLNVVYLALLMHLFVGLVMRNYKR